MITENWFDGTQLVLSIECVKRCHAHKEKLNVQWQQHHFVLGDARLKSFSLCMYCKHRIESRIVQVLRRKWEKNENTLCVPWTSHPCILRRIFFSIEFIWQKFANNKETKYNCQMWRKRCYSALSISVSLSLSVAPSSSSVCMPADMEQISLWTNRFFCLHSW